MKVGILSESDVDEAGIHVLAEATLGFSIETVKVGRIRSRGWPAVIKNLPAIYKGLYWHSDAVGLIVVIDSDDTPVHDITHEESGFNHPKCRGCEVHGMLLEIREAISPRPQGPLNIAVGLAVPAIEAWYQCGLDVHNTEARFSRETPSARYEIRRDLKRKTYGAVSAPMEVMRRQAVEHCKRLGGALDLLERDFPNGFGMLARSLRSWGG